MCPEKFFLFLIHINKLVQENIFNTKIFILKLLLDKHRAKKQNGVPKPGKGAGRGIEKRHFFIKITARPFFYFTLGNIKKKKTGLDTLIKLK